MKRKLTRSENMSRIRGKDTKPEILLRKALWAKGLRYRLHFDLPGHPDLVFSKSRLAVFVDGCFWHGCPYHYSAPRTRADFWKSKLRRNVLRDMEVEDRLKAMDWRVLRIWQHELKDLGSVMERIIGIMETDSVAPVYFRPKINMDTTIAEPVASYGKQETEWRKCPCGSRDVRVLEVSGQGSLRPNVDRRPVGLELICGKCRNVFRLNFG